ncbi:MAG: hypothetical protein EXR21_05580 [Flavobacteriaceae bacterium]|nr:hypothetical protein [Flavobacteriaceae bacterium]
MNLEEEIRDYFNSDYSPEEVVELLANKGFNEAIITAEIRAVCYKILKKDIPTSQSFFGSMVAIGFVSLFPLTGYFDDDELYYAIISILLLVGAYGFYHLNKTAIKFWLLLFCLLGGYIIFLFFNKRFEFTKFFSLIVFCSISIRNINSIFLKVRNQLIFLVF